MMHDWKSTAQGVLTFLLTTFIVILGFTAPYIPLAPGSVKAKLSVVMAVCGLGAALCKAWIAVLTNNADATAVSKAINSGDVSSTPASIATTPKE
jgi:hypothetical protein